MEDFEQAVLCFEHALRLDADNLDLRMELALLLFGARRDQDALDVLRDAPGGERYQYDHLLLRGVLLHRLNRDAEARVEFERAFPP
jgi:Flp pilus assembly protein TadD